MKFVFTDATNGTILWKHGQVFHIVQVAEHAHLAKFCHACEESEANHSIERFQHRIEGFQLATVGILQGGIADGLQQRLVIFIDKDHHALPRLLVCMLYHVDEAFFRSPVLIFAAIQLLPFFKMSVQLGLKRRFVLILTAVQVEVQDGMFRPVFFHLLHG